MILSSGRCSRESKHCSDCRSWGGKERRTTLPPSPGFTHRSLLSSQQPHSILYSLTSQMLRCLPYLTKEALASSSSRAGVVDVNIVVLRTHWLLHKGLGKDSSIDLHLVFTFYQAALWKMGVGSFLGTKVGEYLQLLFPWGFNLYNLSHFMTTSYNRYGNAYIWHLDMIISI